MIVFSDFREKDGSLLETKKYVFVKRKIHATTTILSYGERGKEGQIKDCTKEENYK